MRSETLSTAQWGWRIAVSLAAVLLVMPLAAGEGLPPQVLAKAKDNTVFVRVQAHGQTKIGQVGSGFLITKDTVVTNAHVLGLIEKKKPPKQVFVVFNSGVEGQERQMRATLIGYDIQDDLAFLRLEPVALQQGFKLPTPLSIADTKELMETQVVYILGFPFGKALGVGGANPSVTVGTGSISNLQRGFGNRLDAVQINGDLNPGNSGGPIINAKGELVAVSVATVVGTQIGFAIPADRVLRCLEGRAARVFVDNVRRTLDTWQCDVRVEIVSPMAKITRVEVFAWTGITRFKRPLDKVSGLPRHGAPGDSARRRSQLRANTKGHWVGAIKGLSVVGVENEVWIQPYCQSAKGRQALDTLAIPWKKFIGMAQKNGKPPVGAVAPRPKGKALPGRSAKTNDGHSYILAQTKAPSVSLRGLVALSASPAGDRFYAVFKDVSAVRILDAWTLDDLSGLPCPSAPSDVWADGKHIVATCPKARRVLVFDRAEQKKLHEITLLEKAGLEPFRVCGQTTDGSVMTLWGAKHQTSMRWNGKQVVEVTWKGKSRKLYALPNAAPTNGLTPRTPTSNPADCTQIDWVTCRDRSGALLMQGSHHTSRRNGMFYNLSPALGRCLPIRLAALKTKPFCFARAMVSADRKTILLPMVTDQATLRTYVLDAGLRKVLAEFPGHAVCQDPENGEWVVSNLTNAGLDVMFIDPKSWKIVRQVRGTMNGNWAESRKQRAVEGWAPAIRAYAHKAQRLVEANHSWTAGAFEAWTIRCGPIKVDGKGDDKVNALPPTVQVGEPMTGSIGFTPPRGAKNVRYRVKDPLPGMKLDAATGKVTWTPEIASLGSYDITFLANVDGRQVVAYVWKVEIRMEK